MCGFFPFLRCGMQYFELKQMLTAASLQTQTDMVAITKTVAHLYARVNQLPCRPSASHFSLATPFFPPFPPPLSIPHISLPSSPLAFPSASSSLILRSSYEVWGSAVSSPPRGSGAVRSASVNYTSWMTYPQDVCICTIHHPVNRQFISSQQSPYAYLPRVA